MEAGSGWCRRQAKARRFRWNSPRGPNSASPLRAARRSFTDPYWRVCLPPESRPYSRSCIGRQLGAKERNRLYDRPLVKGGHLFFAALIFFVFVPILIWGSASQVLDLRHGLTFFLPRAVSLFGLRGPFLRPGPR